MKKAIAVLLVLVIIIAGFGVATFTVDKSVISDEQKAAIEKNYAEFISETDGDENKIPIIVHTDQHGMIKFNSEIYKYLNELVDWDKISKIINLGDTVGLILNPFELIAYRNASKYLPEDKRIEVIGNHDRFFVPIGKLVDMLFFPTENAERNSARNAFIVKDEEFNVRYLAVDPKHFPWNYEHGSLAPSLADFVIEQLSKEDDSDIILLSHPYLFKDAVIRRNGETFTGSEFFIGTDAKDTDVKQSFIDMLAARKNKTSGVLIDSKGGEHPYDFSGLKSDFIMALHGHHHSEGYETKDGITEFLFQSFAKDNAKNTEPNCFYFAYIDTQAKTFKCWKNLPGYDAWEISIA